MNSATRRRRCSSPRPTTSISARTLRVKHHGVIAGPYVLPALADTSVGMDRSAQTRIFEPFFTSKEKRKGAGLGLSAVFSIVARKGGHIWVYNEPGKGTTSVFTQGGGWRQYDLPPMIDFEHDHEKG